MLLNCLCLQRVVCGTKCCHGSSSSSNQLPITNDLMLVIWHSLDLHLLDHCMFQAACSLGYFGFPHASEFTIPHLSSFLSSLHLGIQDIAVDSPSAPSCMSIMIKGSKTYIHLGRAVSFTLASNGIHCVHFFLSCAQG